MAEAHYFTQVFTDEAKDVQIGMGRDEGKERDREHWHGYAKVALQDELKCDAAGEWKEKYPSKAIDFVVELADAMLAAEKARWDRSEEEPKDRFGYDRQETTK